VELPPDVARLAPDDGVQLDDEWPERRSGVVMVIRNGLYLGALSADDRGQHEVALWTRSRDGWWPAGGGACEPVRHVHRPAAQEPPIRVHGAMRGPDSWMERFGGAVVGMASSAVAEIRVEADGRSWPVGFDAQCSGWWMALVAPTEGPVAYRVEGVGPAGSTLWAEDPIAAFGAET
jgi:hypothetical protein